MAKLSTCKGEGCEKKLTKEEKYTYNNKSYCKECYDIIIADKENYKKLIDIVCQYYNIVAPTGLILKQIKDYKEQFNYTYNGMIYTLWFLKEIENKQFTEIKYGIALIKYNYEKAKNYYEQQSKISSSISEKPKENIKKITIKPIKNNNTKEKLLFDINSLYEKSGENN